VNETVRRRRMRVLAALFAAAIAVQSASALATDVAPYDDYRDSNYLKVIYHFVYPVGKVAELFFFRPLHAFTGAVGQPDPDRHPDEDNIGACIAFRPERRCSRDH